MTATILISSSPPTRARRPFPTSPTASRSSAASGWAMPSPAAAATATTTRRWASPRAARGKRSSATSAKSAATSRTSRSPCVGVGDMSGDVFGNGMLMSKKTRLLAAFDHRHIFIDPDPDPEASWAERKRMFDLPRSSWADYDTTLISKGGGVFPRTAKDHRAERRNEGAHRPQERSRDAGRDDQSPADGRSRSLVLRRHRHLRQILRPEPRRCRRPRQRRGARERQGSARQGRSAKAPIWARRQPGRIEYAARGGRINTDAIDNSAGVDTSDHEVNLKILMSGRAAAARRTDRPKRATRWPR